MKRKKEKKPRGVKVEFIEIVLFGRPLSGERGR